MKGYKQPSRSTPLQTKVPVAWQTTDRALPTQTPIRRTSNCSPRFLASAVSGCHHEKNPPKNPEELLDFHVNDSSCACPLCTLFHNAALTSDDGQLGIDGDLALAVLRHALVDVLVARRTQGLDSEHGAGALVELDGLWG